ncbi:Hydrogen peroxide-inducible protein activator [compost metagenome]
MTLTQLEYLLAVQDTGSFSQAAIKCHVTQPTLSMQIQKLEDELGATVFDRTKQPIRATALGERILQQARLAVQNSQRITEIIAEDQGELVGEVRLGVIPTLAPYLLPLFLNDFLKKFPRLHLTIEEIETQAMVEKIRSNTLDVGIAVTPIVDINIARKVLFYEPFLVYFAKKHALLAKKQIDEKDLSVDDVLLLNEGHCFREQSLLLCQNRKHQALSKQFSFESGSLETLKKLVDQGDTFTLLPYLASQDALDTKRLRAFNKPVPTREVSLIHGPHFQRKTLVQNLISHIQAHLPNEIQTERTRDQLKVDNPLGHIK